jgi:hypothetical protein
MGLLTSKLWASDQAGKQRARAFDKAGDLLASEWEKTDEQMAPWRTVGQSANDAMALAMGLPNSSGQGGGDRDYTEFYKSPGYKFRMDEGTKAVERSAASRGNLQGGRTQKDLLRYGQGQASQEFGNYMSQLQGMSEAGRNTSLVGGQLRNEASMNRANMLVGHGEARGSGYDNIAQGLHEVGQAAADMWSMGGGAGG